MDIMIVLFSLFRHANTRRNGKIKKTQKKCKDKMNWLYLLADWLNPLADWLNPLADSPFGPYILSELSLSFVNFSTSCSVYMTNKK